MEKETTNATINQQTLHLENRKKLVLSGITKMISVKSELLQLSTNMGDMQIGGENMEIVKLDLEEKLVEVNGLIEFIRYSNTKKQPILKRLFK